MFSHYQRHGKCEWREGGRTEPKPEVLVTDANGSRRMVIERKSVVWPHSYILRHQNEHDFANVIWQRTKGRFQDDCYELTVSAEELGKLDSHTVKQIALEIGSILAENPSSIDDGRTENVPSYWLEAV